MSKAIIFGSCGWLAAADPAWASPVAIDVPEGTLRSALTALSLQAGISIALPGKLPVLNTRRVRGRMEPGEALEVLLAGSPWQARAVGPHLWKLVRRKLPPRPRPERPPPSEVDGADIIVTATKRDQRLRDVALDATVLDSADFHNAIGANSSSDLAEHAVGVFSTNLGPGRDRIFLRGVADSPFNGPTQSTVGLFLDDARINYALPDPDLRLVDIDTVEILRGPQGSLYGAGALGGIVRIVPNRPDLERIGGGVALDGSVTANGAPGGAVEAYLNVPFSSGKTALRMAGYNDSTGGWIDDPGRGATNMNRVTRVGGRADFRWQVASDWTIDLSIAAQDLHAYDTQYATEGLTHATAIAEPHRNQFFLGRLEARGKVAGLDFLSTTAFESNQIDSRFDASAVAAQRGLSTPLAYDERRRVYLVSQEFRLSRPRRWVFGVSILDAVNVLESTFSTPGTTPLAARSQGSLSLEAAMFGEATQPLWRDVDITVGARVLTSTVLDDPRASISTGVQTVRITPSAILSWHPSRDTMVWLRYASAVRPGGRSQDDTGAVVSFRADTLHSIELGNRLALFDRHLFLDAVAFALAWNDVQTDVIGTDGLTFTANAGNAHNLGIEIDSRVVRGGFTLAAGLTRQHGRLYELSYPVPRSNVSLKLPVLPDLSGRLRLSWQGRAGDFGLGAYVGANYWGAAQLSFNPLLDQQVPSRVAVSAGVTIERADWRLTASVANLLDSRANTFAFGNPFTFRALPQYTPPQPRTVGLRLERRF